MEKYEFMIAVQETFEECKTEEEIESISQQMIKAIISQKELSKQYLKLDIL